MRVEQDMAAPPVAGTIVELVLREDSTVMLPHPRAIEQWCRKHGVVLRIKLMPEDECRKPWVLSTEPGAMGGVTIG